MPGTLNHSPADVMRGLLVDKGLGTLPSANSSWPVYAASEPASPDEAITVFDTAGKDAGRVQIDGERQERHGFQVRIRSATHTVGYVKARAIAIALDEQIYLETVSLAGDDYLVHAVSRSSDVLALGKEVPAGKRSLFTVNGTVMLRKL